MKLISRWHYPLIKLSTTHHSLLSPSPFFSDCISCSIFLISSIIDPHKSNLRTVILILYKLIISVCLREYRVLLNGPYQSNQTKYDANQECCWDNKKNKAHWLCLMMNGMIVTNDHSLWNSLAYLLHLSVLIFPFEHFSFKKNIL